MGIYAYQDISSKEIQAKRITSEGKKYTLNHPVHLVIDMRFIGQKKSSANSQGWERNSQYYFRELQQKHPEYFSKKNSYRIENGESPKVDKQFVEHFPQYKGYENETLIHHHIGKDGQAVALPQSVHKGSGEIHIYENRLGVTDKAQQFSNRCQKICEHDPSMVNKTKDSYLNYLHESNKYSNAISRIHENCSRVNSNSNITSNNKTEKRKH